MRTSPTTRTSPVTAVTPPGGRLRVLDAADLDAAAAMLTRGFAEEPGNLELFPDPEIRRRCSELVIRKELRASLPYATVHGIEVDGRLVATAIWHPPHVAPRSLTASMQLASGLLVQAPVLARGIPRIGAVALRHRRGMLRLVRARREAIAAASRGPAWHLAFLATDPDHRGRGLARRLLDHVLDRCDADGLAAWLETTDPVNPPLYERFGFGTILHLDDAAWLPGFWVMRRETRNGERV
jgi:GNAT superfamily N-acetyltransferase